MRTCLWCGKPFKRNYRTEKYCCDEHRKYARQEQNRQRFNKWYVRNKKEINQSDKRSLGSGHLGSSPKKKFSDELNIIQKELRRLKL